MNVTMDLNDTHIADGEIISKDTILAFGDSYRLRTWTSGCYFYDEATKAWIASGMQIRKTMYEATYCRSDHLTAFGTGFFIVPNEMDFEYIYATQGFEDNLTVYFTLIITLIFYILFSIWAR